MNLAAVVLAAGIGKRMRSARPKVLHEVCGLPMLRLVLDAVRRLRPERTIVIVGRHEDEIREAIADAGVIFVRQQQPRGTGDALRQAAAALKGFNGTVLVLNGDTPLITSTTLGRFTALHRRNRGQVSTLSFIASDPAGYGRIIRDREGRPEGIREEKDATPEERSTTEVNSGVYAINADALTLLDLIRPSRVTGEYYLTDILGIAASRGFRTGVYCVAGESEMMGVNTGSELLAAEKHLRGRIVARLMDKGVRFLDPVSAYIHAGVRIGPDTTIYPNVYIEGASYIGRGCIICPNVRISGSSIGDGAVVRDSSVVESSTVRRNAQIGPFAHIRPGSVIGSGARIGNFVEVKKSTIGSGTKASHLSYIGDAIVGREVNIGAGTITCNYDGRTKHKTEIMDRAFIGSDSQLVAPVRIGRGAYVGAGSTITEDVPPLSLAIGRAGQKNIKGWARKRRGRQPKSGD